MMAHPAHDAEQHKALVALAVAIRRVGMLAPARLVLDVLAPLSVITSQLAIFMQPLVPGARWRSYMVALSDEAGWESLRGLLQEEESS
ncbi:MAG TPA: hypothetical protein PKC19_05915 [Roseiflexaceae bacterium]|nr:hypothetical protein [Roseiflexaceae bacterium]